MNVECYIQSHLMTSWNVRLSARQKTSALLSSSMVANVYCFRQRHPVELRRLGGPIGLVQVNISNPTTNTR